MTTIPENQYDVKIWRRISISWSYFAAMRILSALRFSGKEKSFPSTCPPPTIFSEKLHRSHLIRSDGPSLLKALISSQIPCKAGHSGCWYGNMVRTHESRATENRRHGKLHWINIIEMRITWWTRFDSLRPPLDLNIKRFSIWRLSYLGSPWMH